MNLNAVRLREILLLFDSIPYFSTYTKMMEIPSDNFDDIRAPNAVFFPDVLSYLELLTKMGYYEAALEFKNRVRNHEISASANDNQQYVFGNESITLARNGLGSEPKCIASGKEETDEMILIREYLPSHFYEDDLVWITHAHLNLEWARRLIDLRLEKKAEASIRAIQSSHLMRRDGFLNSSYKFKRGMLFSFDEVYSLANVDYVNTLLVLGYLEEAKEVIRRIWQSNLQEEKGLLVNYAWMGEDNTQRKSDVLANTNAYWAATLYKAGVRDKAMEIVQELESMGFISEDGLLLPSLEKKKTAFSPSFLILNVKWIRYLITLELEERVERAVESVRRSEALYNLQVDYTKPLNQKNEDIELYSNWTMALLGVGI